MISKQTSTAQQDTLLVDFWNGNRSEIRQSYESDVLKAVLEETRAEFGAFQLKESREDYPRDEESKAFTEKNHDVLVTVAGNRKFKTEEVTLISRSLAKNILGYRIPIIKEKDSMFFSKITEKQIKSLTHGVPETWSDADILRHNAFAISEEGNFEDIFERLSNDNFDYLSFGANEVYSIFQNRASKEETLCIEQHNLLYYPFPLVFYIHPKKGNLAKRIEAGLAAMEANGKLDALFKQHYGTLVKDLELEKRKVFILKNPLVFEEFAALKPDLTKL